MLLSLSLLGLRESEMLVGWEDGGATDRERVDRQKRERERQGAKKSQE